MVKVSIVHVSEPKSFDELDAGFITSIKEYSDKTVIAVTGEITPDMRGFLSDDKTDIMVIPGGSRDKAWSEAYRVCYDTLQDSDIVIFASTDAYYRDLSVDKCISAMNEAQGDIFSAACDDPPFVILSKDVIKDYSFSCLFKKNENCDEVTQDHKEDTCSEITDEDICDETSGEQPANEPVLPAAGTDIAAHFEKCGFKVFKDDQVLKIVLKNLLRDVNEKSMDDALNEAGKVPPEMLACVRGMAARHNTPDISSVVFGDCTYKDHSEGAEAGGANTENIHLFHVIYDRSRMNMYNEIYGELIRNKKITFIVPYEIQPDLLNLIPDADTHPAYPAEIDLAFFDMRDRTDEKYAMVLSDKNIGYIGSPGRLYGMITDAGQEMENNKDRGIVIQQVFETLSVYENVTATRFHISANDIDPEFIITFDMPLYRGLCGAETPAFHRLPVLFAENGRTTGFLRYGVSLNKQLMFLEKQIGELIDEETERADPSDELLELLHEAEDSLEKTKKENNDLKKKIKNLTDQNKKLREMERKPEIREVPVAVDIGVKGALKNWMNKNKQ